jgi:hypothetical protein
VVDGSSREELSVTQKCAVLLVNDLCQMARCEPPAWLKFKVVHSDTHPLRILSLDLLDAILSEHAWIFCRLPELTGLLCTQVCPLILQDLMNPDTEKFQILVRLVRISCSILQMAMDEDRLIDPCKALLSAIISFVDLACTSIPPNANFSQQNPGSEAHGQGGGLNGTSSSATSSHSKAASWLGSASGGMVGRSSDKGKASTPKGSSSGQSTSSDGRLGRAAHAMMKVTGAGGNIGDGDRDDSVATSPALPWPTVLGLEALALIIEKPHLVRFFFSKLDNPDNTMTTAPPLSPSSKRAAWNNGIFARMLQTLSFFVVSFSPSSSNAWPSTDALSAALGSKSSRRAMQNTPHKTVRALNMLHEDSLATSPAVGSAHGLVLAVRSLVRVVDALDELSESPLALSSPVKVRSASGSSSIALAAAPSSSPKGNAIMVGIVEASWRPILSALSSLLIHCEQEMLVQFVLKAFQTFTNTCGLLGLEASRDSFLSSLCFHTLPAAIRSLVQTDTDKSSPLLREDSYFMPPRIEWKQFSIVVNQFLNSPSGRHSTRTSMIISPKNIQALHCLFGIAHCLGSFLGSAWHVVLATFEVLDFLTRDGSTSNKSEEMDIFKSMLRSLFESSRYLEDAAVIHLATALAALSKAAIQVVEPEGTDADRRPSDEGDPWSMDPEGSGSGSGSGTSKPTLQRSTSSAPPSFALRHLCLTAQHNTSRLKILWPLLSAHLLDISRSETSQALRTFSTDSLIQLLISSLTFVDDKKVPPLPVATAPMTQEELIVPLETLMDCGLPGVRENMLQGLFTLLQLCGHKLDDGWPKILSILQLAAERYALNSFLPIMFHF